MTNKKNDILNLRFKVKLNPVDIEKFPYLKDKYVDCGHYYLMEKERFKKTFLNAISLFDLSNESIVEIGGRIHHYGYNEDKNYFSAIELTSAETHILHYAHNDVLLWDALNYIYQKFVNDKLVELPQLIQQISKLIIPDIKLYYTLANQIFENVNSDFFFSPPYKTNNLKIYESDEKSLEGEQKAWT